MGGVPSPKRSTSRRPDRPGRQAGPALTRHAGQAGARRALTPCVPGRRLTQHRQGRLGEAQAAPASFLYRSTRSTSSYEPR